MPDIDLAYTTLGEGEPVILLHGWGGSHRSFRGLAEHLAVRFRVILPDNRGHGASPMGRRRLTLRLMADDTARLMDKLGIAHCRLVGFSDGGNIALRLASLDPGRIDRLVCISANARISGVNPWFLRIVSLWAKVTTTVRRWGPGAEPWARRFDLLLREPDLSAAELGRITAPLLLFSAEHDLISPKDTRFMSESVRGSRWVTVPGTTHLNILREWEKYAEVLDNFLEGDAEVRA